VTVGRGGGRATALACLLLGLALTGCQVLAVTAFGAGASAGVSHTINGIATRTFAAATDQVHAATLAALRRLGMRYETLTDRGKLVMVKADAGPTRRIEIEFQELTRNATQVRITVRTGGLLYDRATADEIIQITERQLADRGT
jgi:hypothetical protein